MKILFVAMANSVHTQRWISQLQGLGWDLHVFPVEDELSPEARQLPSITLHEGGPQSLPWRERARRLAAVIQVIRPDFIHSLEIQHAGYLTQAARDILEPGAFPVWIVSNWGSDLFLFGRLKEHRPRIEAVMRGCQFYVCECDRDIPLARSGGFAGDVLPVVPMGGGYRVRELQALCPPGPTSARRMILLRGYQSWAGRALVGLKALRMCADALPGYRIVVYLAGGQDVRIAAELLANDTGLHVEMPRFLPHNKMIALQGRARVSIGLSISDGISHSFLEAMMMGAFPIQSPTACVDEWATDGESALFVDPDDPAQVAEAIRRAVADDAMVDGAAAINMRTTGERLEYSVIQPQVIGMYERAYARVRDAKSARSQV